MGNGGAAKRPAECGHDIGAGNLPSSVHKPFEVAIAIRVRRAQKRSRGPEGAGTGSDWHHEGSCRGKQSGVIMGSEAARGGFSECGDEGGVDYVVKMHQQ